MGDIVCTRAYMQFDLICVHFPHMMILKWIFSNVNINFESIGGVVFPHVVNMHLSHFKRTVSNINLLRCILMNIYFNFYLMSETTRLRRNGRMDLELFFTFGKYPLEVRRVMEMYIN